MFDLNMSKRTIVQCGIAAAVSLVLMSWLRVRPLGLLFCGLLCFWFCKTRCNFVIVPPPELQNKYKCLIALVTDLRKNRPTMFCAVTSGCLGVLAVLGHVISGSTVVLMGLVLAAIISTKYNFKFIKIEPKDFAWSEKLNHDPELDDEFIPEVNESNLFVLERASDLASLSLPTEEVEEEEKSDDIPSELLLPDAIPEVGDHSSDDNEEDYVPVSRQDKIAAKDSDAIEFKKGHFKRDSSLSSTSSEESLSKGLHFPDHTTVDGPALRQLPASQNQEASDLMALAIKSQTQNLLTNGSKLLPTLMSGLVQWSTGSGASVTGVSHTQRVVTALDSSDESDFEILENDDFK